MMLRRLLVPAAALAVAFAAVTPARAASTVVNVSRRAGDQSEAAVAASPVDPVDFVVASNTVSGFGIFVGVTHDGGVTWSRRVLGDGDRFGRACCDPTITWDRYGNLFLTWLGYGNRAYPTKLPILLSTDAGDTWRLLERLDPPAPASTRMLGPALPVRGSTEREGEERGPGAIDQPTITTGPRSLWAIWSSDGIMQATGARIHGLGDVGGFRRVREIPGSRDCTFGDVAVGPGGAVAHVCQRDIRGTSPVRSRIHLNIDPDGLRREPFGRATVPATTNVSLFEPIRPQRVRTIDAEAGLAWIVVGPHRGRLVLLFTAEMPDQSDDTNVYVKVSDDAGATWTPRIVVTAATRSQFLPRLAMDPATGDLVAGWHDAQLDDGVGAYDTDGLQNTDAMYAMSFSSDGGLTWSLPQMMSDAASNARASKNAIEFGDYTGLSFAFGVAHGAWADNSNSTGDNPSGTLSAFDVYSAAGTDS